MSLQEYQGDYIMHHIDSFDTLGTFDNSGVMNTMQSAKKTTVQHKRRKPLSIKEKKRQLFE